MAQIVCYRFNADQMIRLAKGIQEVDVENIEGAWIHLMKTFDNHPGHYFLHPIYAAPVPPNFEEINIIFVIFASRQSKPMPFSTCRRLPRFAQAVEYLKAHGITEVDDLKLVQLYI